MAEKKIGRKRNWLKIKLARKKLAKTLAWHTCLASPYSKMSKKIEKKNVLLYISTLEHSFQPSLNSSVGRACRSCPEDWGSIPP